MQAHGPDQGSYQKAMNAPLKRKRIFFVVYSIFSSFCIIHTFDTLIFFYKKHRTLSWFG